MADWITLDDMTGESERKGNPDRFAQLLRWRTGISMGIALWGCAARTWGADSHREAPGFLSLSNAHLPDRDGFAKEKAIRLWRGLDRFEALLENRGGAAHTTTLTIEGLRAGLWQVRCGARRYSVTSIAGQPALLRIELPAGGGMRVECRR